MWQTLAALLSQASTGDWLLLSSALLLLLYVMGTWNYDYFRKQGIPSSKPKWPFLGDVSAGLLGRRSIVDDTKEIYEIGKGHALYGIFTFTKPTFMVRDPELLKTVTIKDFDSFMNHRKLQGERAEPVFMKNLVNLRDQEWKDMRATLSPAFTTSKIKGMFPLISQCAEQMTQHLRKNYSNSPEGAKKNPLSTDMKDLFARMANDVIATAAFGVSCDSLKQPENEFYHMAKLMTTFSTLRSLSFVGYLAIPKVMEAFGIRLLNGKAISYFCSLVQETVQEREKQSIFRPDMLQLLMQAREGRLRAEAADEQEAEQLGVGKKKLTDDDISAQAIIFFFAGFETVSTALCLTSCVLSHHPEEQKRLQAEVDEVMEKTGRKPTYEAVQDMKYLDAVINETLRLYPPAVGTDRECRKDTILPATVSTGPVTVRKGDVISIPIIGIHHDPEYWPNPEKFDPDRFSDENKNDIKPFTYMPFGLGPRLCIGQRFALIEVKLALVLLLANFNLSPSDKMKYPLRFQPGFNIVPLGGYCCGITPREA